MNLRVALLAAALLVPLPVAPVAGQGEGLTLDQVQRQYRRMSEVHIVKCDRDGDQLFTRTELLCVRSIYHAMYIED